MNSSLTSMGTTMKLRPPRARVAARIVSEMRGSVSVSLTTYGTLPATKVSLIDPATGIG